MKKCINQPKFEIKKSNFYIDTIQTKKELKNKLLEIKKDRIKTIEHQFEIIVDTVCFYLSVNVEDVFSRTRKQRVVEARYFICYICRVEFRMIFSFIGKNLKRDHSTIIHGVQAIEDLMKYEQNTREKVVYLRHVCKHKLNEDFHI